MASIASLVAIGGAALVAGAVNAIAGGGSLLTFPVLVAAGLPPVTASITNTVAMCPGYVGATYAQRSQLAGQRARLELVLPVGAVAGMLGALLLLFTTATAFDHLVPFLILFATVLVALQDHLRRWLFGRTRDAVRSKWLVALPVLAAGTYGGYFGAGMGVIVLAALGIVLEDSLARLNATKQAVTLAANIPAAVVFIASGRVDWPIAVVMMVMSLLGGIAGGAVAAKISSKVLRVVIVVIGTGVAIVYFARW